MAERSPQSPSSKTSPVSPRRQKQLQQLLNGLGIGKLPDPSWHLLDEALVHRSESSGKDYERLEFFGDAVLRMAASQYLLEHHRHWSVGDMTAVRNVIVSDRYLSKIARHYHLARYLVTAKTVMEHIQGSVPHCPPSQLADIVESLIGALYAMTGSLEWVLPWLMPFWDGEMEQIYRDPVRQNHKAALQEWTQRHFKALPHYTAQEDSEKVGAADRFEAQVWFGEQQLGAGTGKTRKEAEQAAAKQAFDSLPDPETLTPPPSQQG